MTAPGLVNLANLRLQAQQRSDQVNSSFLSTSEWNTNLSASYKELYDLLVGAYGTNYSVATAFQFVTDGTTFLYPLPADFYKLLGVDLSVNGSPQSFLTIRPFNFADRNRYSLPNFQSFYGVVNVHYKLHGTNIWLTPIPQSGQTIQLWYIPEPTNLQIQILGSTASSTTVTTPDTSLLSVGMFVSGSGITTGTTITAITLNTSITLSVAATATASNVLLACWDDSRTFDGIAGWEEYVVLDAAIKAMAKEESDASTLGAQKGAILNRIQNMAEARDAGNPSTVADSAYSNTDWTNQNSNGGGYF